MQNEQRSQTLLQSALTLPPSYPSLHVVQYKASHMNCYKNKSMLIAAEPICFGGQYDLSLHHSHAIEHSYLLFYQSMWDALWPVLLSIQIDTWKKHHNDSITYKYLHQSEKSVSEHKLLFSNPNKVIFKSQILVLIFLLHQT